jgi:hypothetical protein
VFFPKICGFAATAFSGESQKYYENQRRGHTFPVSPENLAPLKTPMRGSQKNDPRFVDFFRPLLFPMRGRPFLKNPFLKNPTFLAKNCTLAPVFSHF